ncbi:hypothetical protein [Fictibacillus enclensis]|uniref:hypothetical protein n=1 Tax=Fictibacillus enclensis TaxID=1017270 RepID=UPI0024BFD626|nr:hypothetical protein [Fictibacillus enclensis]WHY71068.1 hypothetical protein QNH15_18870 [Fictibacillus enclensis]
MIPQAETGAALHQALPVSSLKLNHHQAVPGLPAARWKGHRIDVETAIVVRFRLFNVIAAVLDPPMKIR